LWRLFCLSGGESNNPIRVSGGDPGTSPQTGVSLCRHRRQPLILLRVTKQKDTLTSLLIRKIENCRDRRPGRSAMHKSAEILFSLPICVIMGLTKSLPCVKGGGSRRLTEGLKKSPK